MLIDIHTYRREKITNSEIVWNILKEVISKMQPFDADKEHLWVLGLTASNGIKYIDHVSMGSQKYTIAEASEVFRMAIHKGASTIIIAHNHPSGNATPSESDKLLTKTVCDAGKILKVLVIDHIIVCEEGYYSFADNGGI
jgi:DNA repair protein RadC